MVLQLAHQAHRVSALPTVGLECGAEVAGVGSGVEEVADVAGFAVCGGVAGETAGWAVGALAGRRDVEADHAGQAVRGRVAGRARMHAEVAREGGSDVHLLRAVEAVVGAVAEQAFGRALVAQVAAVEPIPTLTTCAFGGAATNQTI